jgi:tetratricopeptide (TPR) repeat protein
VSAILFANNVLQGIKKHWRLTLLLAAALFVYGNSLRNGFTLDDEAYIVQNHQVTDLSLKEVFQPNQYANIFRPVTFSSFALNWAIGGARPFGYHLLNMLLHAAVTLLLYLLLRALLDSLPQGETVSFMAALLFAVHPIHVEAVASIVGRSEMLAAGFLMAAWLLHLRDRQILSLLCFVLALLSKESAVVFTPVLLVGDYSCGKLKTLQRYGWFAGVTGIYLALLWKVQGGRFGPKEISFLDNPLASLPASLRILNALRIAWKYIGLHLYPATLSCDYSYNAILIYAKWRYGIAAALAASMVVILWLWAVRTRRSAWALAGAIYFGSFAVTANVLLPSATIMAERLAYLPSAGFCLLIAMMWIWVKNRNAMLAWTVLGAVVVLLGTRTMIRNRDWQDNFTLEAAAVKAVPGSAKMHVDLGAEYMYRGQLSLAGQEYETSLQIYPTPEALEWNGILESKMGHDQQALRLLQKALLEMRKNTRNYDFAVVNLAAQEMKVGQQEDALKLLNQEIAESPGYSRAWSNRAVIRLQRGEIEWARSDAQTAVSLDPTNEQAEKVLGSIGLPNPLSRH